MFFSLQSTTNSPASLPSPHFGYFYFAEKLKKDTLVMQLDIVQST